MTKTLFARTAFLLTLTSTLFAQEAPLVPGQNAFSTDLYRTLKAKPGNLFISPYNVSLVLDMAYIGARGKTKEEMAKVLYCTNSSDDTLSTENAKEIQFLSPGFQSFEALAIDNSYKPLPSYTEKLKKDFQADVLSVDFVKNKTAALAQINGWVKQKTEGKIPFILQDSDVTDSTKLVLLAASHFKKSWRDKFESSETKKALFTTREDEKIEVDMMRQQAFMSFFETPQALVAELNYAKEENDKADYSCVIILPTIKEMFPLIGDSLTEAQINEWLKNSKRQMVELFLPKFKIDYQCSLKEPLESLGMRLAFTDKADFSAISAANDLAIGKVLHRAFLQIDENGSEAAAASAATMVMKAMAPIEKQAVMRCDTPFYLVIREKTTGLFLFVARVENPSAAT